MRRRDLYPILFGSSALVTGALLALKGEPQGLSVVELASNVQLAIKDTTTPSNNRSNIDINDVTSPFVESGTSPKLTNQPSGLLAWTNHNLFVNSTSAPATQNVTLITGATYTYGVSGSGSLAGSSGASGTASAGSPVTFVATGTTGTFTVTGSLTTMQINRGSVLTTPYHATGAAAWYAVPTQFDAASGLWGLLVEPAATNIIVNGQAVAGTGWSSSGSAVTVTTNAGTAPDGTASATRLQVPAEAQGNGWIQTIALAASQTHTISVFYKSNTGGNQKFALKLTQQSVADHFSPDLTATQSWQRATFSAAFGSGGTGSAFVGVTTDAAGEAADMLVWCFQAEPNTAVATSPIPTFASSITRSADADNAALSAAPSITTTGMLAIGAKTSGASVTQTLWAIDDGTTSERYRFYRDSSNHIHFVVTHGGVDQADIDLGSVANNTSFTVAASWTANSIKASLNAGAVTTDSSATLPTSPTTMRNGYDTGGNQWNSSDRKVILLPRAAVSDAELQSIQAKAA